jgi:prevent-host-death family protein
MANAPGRNRDEATVSIRAAKASLSRLAKQLRAGTRVVITDHGKPVADLVPHGMGLPPRRHLKRPGPLPKPIWLEGDGATVSALVLADRGV